MTNTPKFRAGDVVRYRSGVKLRMIGAVQEGGKCVIFSERLPEKVYASDCEMEKAATDEQHRNMVAAWVNGKNEGDERAYYNRHAAVALGIGEYVEVPCCHCSGSGTTIEFRVKEVANG